MRLSVDDLLCELRLKNIACVDDVDYAILEQNGQISVFDSSDKDALAYAVIVDGKINPAALRAAGKNENWLTKQLAAQNCTTDAVFLMTVTDSGSLYFVKKK